jgi:hypothetical protein
MTYFSTPITGVPRSSGTSVDLYQTIRHYFHLMPRLRMSGNLLLFPPYDLMACTRQLYLHGFASWEKVVFVKIQLSCRVNSVCPNSLCLNVILAVVCQVKRRYWQQSRDGDDTDLLLVWTVHTCHNSIVALSCLRPFDIHKLFSGCSLTHENLL